ncbi:glycoside hydrolase domain-containing protein [Solilutibacter silvestris]|nr:glycoside hydrolase domain-containing protein [Lysobacter silvestris]
MRLARLRPIVAALALGVAMLPPCASAQDEKIATTVEQWDRYALGNHRYAVDVAASAPAVQVTIPWRLRDRAIGEHKIIVTDAAGKPVANVLRRHVDQSTATLVFEPTQGAGRYFIYFQPYTQTGSRNYPKLAYQPWQDTATPTWSARIGATSPAKLQALPRAKVAGYEAVDPFDAYTDMERIATPAEIARVLHGAQQAAFLLFGEDRAHPVRMFDQLPQRWAARGPGKPLHLGADRGEFLSFQLGLWTPNRALNDVRIELASLQGANGARIDTSKLHRFALGGTDYQGQPFSQRHDVAQGRIDPLWLGLDIPADAKPGRYRGTAIVSTAAGSARLPIEIDVGVAKIAAHGDDQPQNLTRLHWLDSTLYQDDSVVAPYTPVQVQGDVLSILGRHVRIGADGLPAAIDSEFTPRMTSIGNTPRALLAAPMQLVVEGGGKADVATVTASPKFETLGPARVRWNAASQVGPLQQDVQGELEADGSLHYRIALKATQATTLRDIRLEIPFAADGARYMVGLGRPGDETTDRFDWKWDVQKNQDGAWIGDVNAGLEFRLRDDRYERPLNTNFYHDKPLKMPLSWDNGGKGGICMARTGDRYDVIAFSGPRTMQAGETLHYDIELRITPFKTINPQRHFSQRFFHKYAPLDEITGAGATVVNIHHATPINPWINYPFLEPAKMKAYIDAAHARGMKVKIYNTIRELSDHAPEVPVLESLGSEIISPGKGGGWSWLQEHFDGDYIPAWHVPEIRDAAIINSGASRWNNYYIEGMDWLARNVGIDGLYLDDVAFDRVTMKRVRKALAAHRPDPLIDLHSANQYNDRDGWNSSALLYMEQMPYLDRLWFGEYFDYQKTSPAYWLTEISGIPYGLMGEMLQDGGNPWRGMVFGMTNRMPWTGGDPRRLWKAWDAFGIDQAEMIGWWAPDAPVKTGRKDVLATVYQRQGRAMIAIASWAPQATSVPLQIDWKALGIDPAKATITAAAIAGFQPARTFKRDEAIPLEPGKGWLLVVQ